MPRQRLAAISVGCLALAACSPQMDRERDIRAPAARVLGAAESCVDTGRIRNTQVHDDYTIDFEMNGDQIFRNTLPFRCAGLGFEERFAYETTIGRLCSTDTITVLYSDGSRGATCGLGPYVPVEIIEAAG